MTEPPVVVAEWLASGDAVEPGAIEGVVRALFRMWKQREGDAFDQVAAARVGMLLRLLYPDVPVKFRELLEKALRETNHRGAVESLFLELGRLIEIMRASEVLARPRPGPTS